MSRVVRSDKLKTKKTPNLSGSFFPCKIRSSKKSFLELQEGTLNKKIHVKKPTPSTALKASSNSNGSSIPVVDEKEKSKRRAANVTSNNTKEGPHKLQQTERKSGNPHANKLVSRKVSSTSQQQKHVPSRAKQLPTTSKAIRSTSHKNNSPTATDKTPTYKKLNPVLDTPHNVTVCSPPPKKRNDGSKAVSNDEQKPYNSKIIRKGSRTLAPDEIVILKRDPSEMKTEVKDRSKQAEDAPKLPVRLNQPVAFEVKFKDKPVKGRSTSREKLDVFDGTDNDYEERNYSDDFESYESDFETDSSAHSEASSSDSPSFLSQDISEIVADKREETAAPDDSFNHSALDAGENGHHVSELRQSTTMEILKDKEGKLDSGHYDMNSRNISAAKSPDKPEQFIHPIVTNSLDTFSLGASDQMDSGISTCATSIPATFNKNNVQIVYGGYKDFYAKPIINARGSELMTKIQFDALSFTLVDLKPITYDIFMQTFGKLNTNQNSAQTDGNQMHVEQQTEAQETRSIWTQHPPQFQFEISQRSGANRMYNQHCCGDVMDEHQSQFAPQCELEQSLNAIKQLHGQCPKREHDYRKQQRTPINYENLNSFLLRSSLLIDQILGSSTTNTNSKPATQNSPQEHDQVALKRLSEKSFYMATNLLNTLRVLKIFSNSNCNLLITVHESLPDTNVYNSDFANLLMVWCTSACDKPMRLLTTWSQVSKIEISNDSSDIIVAALRDGSIALWDLRETYSFCSKLDGYLTHFAATQSIIPSFYGEKSNAKLIMDLGACLDVKSFRSQTNKMLTQPSFPKTQFVSLHDSGFVTIWTLVETSEMAIDVSQTKTCEAPKYSPNLKKTFEYTSPWARVKLMQSTLANLKEHLDKKSYHSQSRFDKTKALFQKNIYSDEALQELHEYNSEVGQQGIRFSSLECGSENLFICTNRNFILMCSKTLKMEKLKRITINESQFLFPTALKVLSSEHFLAVGLSNGVVMILNCQSHTLTDAYAKTKKSTLLETAGAKRDLSFDNSDAITGKSCAIQNILINVEKSYGDMNFDREYRPSTAACISLVENKRKPFEIRILDQQVIMSGSVLRRNLIQSLELSSDGWYLFALANGHLRVFDFYLDQEIVQEESHEAGKIIGIATGKCSSREHNLMILRRNTEVEVHILNK